MKVVEFKKRETAIEKVKQVLEFLESEEGKQFENADCCVVVWSEKTTNENGTQYITRKHDFWYIADSIFAMTGALQRTISKLTGE